ncbi:hypothetical protein [Haloarcula amylovorans]|uniref:hypothetical protein n=1 Tax=Haloarcula amylovorans TaxID=2562280 RepID=UPI00107666BF|nr:hypothetical protein [Halomicroarcula amylolytica]
MTAEVEFLIERIDKEYGAGAMPAGYGEAGEDPPPLEVVDRVSDEYDAGEGLAGGGSAGSSDRGHTLDLTKTNVVSIAPVDESSTPIGTEYDHSIERSAGVRIEGLHHGEWGHIDSNGEQGIPWPALVRTVRRAIMRVRTFPDTQTPDIRYTHLQLANAAPQSHNYGDYFRRDEDVQFDGFERLPVP